MLNLLLYYYYYYYYSHLKEQEIKASEVKILAQDSIRK